MSNLEATFYLQLVPKLNSYTGKANRFTVARVTTRKPTEPLPSAVVVKVKFRVPAEVFEPLSPSAVIEIPDSLVQRPVEVEAQDALQS